MDVKTNSPALKRVAVGIGALSLWGLLALWSSLTPPHVAELPDVEVLRLDLRPKQAAKFKALLAHTRNLGTRDHLSRQWSRAHLQAEGVDSECRLRLRGDFGNHWAGEKVSVRVRLPSTVAYRGSRSFGLVIPDDRKYAQEQAADWWSRKLGMVPAASRLVWVKSNTLAEGIYLLLEERDADRLERERRVPGPIYRTGGDPHFSQTGRGYWNHPATTYSLPFFKVEGGTPRQQLATNRLLMELLREFRQAPETPLDLTRLGRLLDLEKLAAFSAACRIVGTHPESPHNLQLYFNSLSGRFEPILQDPEAIKTREVDDFDQGCCDHHFTPFSNELLAQPEFWSLRNRQLERVVALGPEFLDFANRKGPLAEQVRRLDPLEPDAFTVVVLLFRAFDARLTLAKDYLASEESSPPSLHYPPLNPGLRPIVHLVATGESRRALEPGPARVTFRHARPAALTLRTLIVSGPGSDQVECHPAPHRRARVAGSTRFEWEAGDGVSLPPNADTSLSLTGYEPQTMAIDAEFADAAGAPPLQAAVSQASNADVHLEFLEQTVEGALSAAGLTCTRRDGALHVVAGHYPLTNTLVVPPGERWTLDPGVELQLGPEVSLLSYSPLRIQGTPEQPVIVHGQTPQTEWGALAVIGAGQESLEVTGLVCRGGRGAHVNGLVLSGAISCFGGDVTISHSSFIESGGDDALNVKGGQVSLTDTVFVASPSDAIDLDWCKGSVERCLLVDQGGDGIDISGADPLTLVDCAILSTGDKAVSVGERSRVSIRGCLLFDAEIGVASKDLSRTASQGNRIGHTATAFTAYRKKAIFGGASLTSTGDRLDAAASAHPGRPDGESALNVDAPALVEFPASLLEASRLGAQRPAALRHLVSELQESGAWSPSSKLSRWLEAGAWSRNVDWN